jgi:cytochrome c biogenesis protein CcmG, thiol:disulfide interchange protein DsbE
VAAVYTCRVKLLLLALSILGVTATAATAAEDPAAALSLMKPKPTQQAKNFQLSMPDNRPVSLADFKGKVVFLNFWATWCKPCEEEMPGMERLYRQYKDKGLVVLAISEDAEGAPVVNPFVKKHNLTFPIGLDPKMAIAGLYGVWAVPATFVIDRSGQRAFFANGPRDWGGPAAQAFFESLLK